MMCVYIYVCVRPCVVACMFMFAYVYVLDLFMCLCFGHVVLFSFFLSSSYLCVLFLLQFFSESENERNNEN